MPQMVQDNRLTGGAHARPANHRGRPGRGHPVPRRRAFRRGQVLVIMLLAIAVLAGLVFYVYDVGANANLRLELQNVADSVAVSGAGWMARSMNIIALNNVAMSRMVGIIPVLDAQPLSVEMALEEIVPWVTSVNANRVQFGDPGSPRDAAGFPTLPSVDFRSLVGPRAADVIFAGWVAYANRFVRQISVLDMVDSRINTARSGFRMEETTTWSVAGVGGAPPHGKLWQIAMTCKEFAQAAWGSAGALAAADAHRFGQANGVEAAFVVPVLPQLPAVEGTFQLFQPVLQGREHVESMTATYSPTGGNGGAIPDFAYPHRLGPWARLYRWRHPSRTGTAQEWVPPTPGVGRVQGPRGISLGGRRVGTSARTPVSGHGGYWVTTDWIVNGYNTYGPYWWAMDVMNWYAQDHWGMDRITGRTLHAGDLADTEFWNYLGTLSTTKLNYMFNYTGMKTIHYPQYHTSYPECVALSKSAPAVRIAKTMFYMVDIASRYQRSDAQWLEPGSYRSNSEPPPRGKGYPMAVWTPGWVDPEEERKNPRSEWKDAVKVADYIWRNDYQIEVTEDRDLGITAQIDPITGRPVWQPVYMTQFMIFGGVDTGGEREISNPANWDQFDVIPAPILLDTSKGDYDPADLDHDLGFRRSYFTYLGVARKDHKSPVYAQRFSNVNPVGVSADQQKQGLGGIVTMAQVELFNTSSWDLWTQDWRVQLVPVTKWTDWTGQLNAAYLAGDAAATDGAVTDAEIQTILKYMSALDPKMAENFLKH